MKILVSLKPSKYLLIIFNIIGNFPHSSWHLLIGQWLFWRYHSKSISHFSLYTLPEPEYSVTHRSPVAGSSAIFRNITLNLIPFPFPSIHQCPHCSSFKTQISPSWCGSVDWVLARETKSRRLDSQSGQMPGLRAISWVGGVQEETTHWYFSPSFSPSLPLSLKINK